MTMIRPAFRPTFRHTSVAVLLAASLAANAFAAAAPDNTDAPDAPAADQGPDAGRDAAHGGPDHGLQRPHDDFGGHGPGGPGPDMPFAFGHGWHGPHGLHRLQLTEAQQDKLFAIEHAAAPQRREHDKAIRKAHEALRDLGRADRFDDARAAAVSRDLGQAVAARALAEARVQAQVLAVLTPGQREQLQREQPQREQLQRGQPWRNDPRRDDSRREQPAAAAGQGGAPARP